MDNNLSQESLQNDSSNLNNQNNNKDINATKINSKEKYVYSYLNRVKNPFVMLSVEQVSKDLHMGLNQTRDLFEQDDFPSVQVGKRKKVSLTAYLFWKLNNSI